ncbi:MAG: hypothetical protein NTZ01_08220 [Verrucomicrobia bacterium]|nr:hypothetical protein [Verrucomicrobiota bacterium]
MAKKSNPKQPSAPLPCTKKRCCLHVLVAGAIGFIAAVLLSMGCPMLKRCPIYSEICPVTTNLKKMDTALTKGDLPTAQGFARKLSKQFEPSLPDLSALASQIASSRTIPEARSTFDALQKKMMSDISGPHHK